MSGFVGVVRYEYLMGVRRWAVWLAFALAAAPYLLNLSQDTAMFRDTSPADLAATYAVMLNVLMPVVGGIVLADRLTRDSRLGVQELLFSTPLRRRGYVLGKYLGGVLAVLTPVLVVCALVGLGLVAAGAPPLTVGYSLLAFAVVNAPVYAFVGAFSIACPAVMPVRVFQVLFTGYWFWGNFLTPEFIPTISGTILNASGRYAASGFFGLAARMEALGGHTTLEAVLNLLVLAGLASLALLVLDRYLAWQQSRA